MQHQPLQQVIDTEDEIRRRIIDERNKADEWVNSVRLDCERETEEERQRLEISFDQAVGEARQQRQAAAKRLLADTDSQASSLENVDEKMLRDILQRHLGAILPEGAEEENG